MEASPKTVRKCGSVYSQGDEGGACIDALQDRNKIILCHCDQDQCNAASTLLSSPMTRLLTSVVAPSILNTTTIDFIPILMLGASSVLISQLLLAIVL